LAAVAEVAIPQQLLPVVQVAAAITTQPQQVLERQGKVLQVEWERSTLVLDTILVAVAVVQVQLG
jgi:hypothetical protein